jgi:hypothetical protein
MTSVANLGHEGLMAKTWSIQTIQKRWEATSARYRRRVASEADGGESNCRAVPKSAAKQANLKAPARHAKTIEIKLKRCRTISKTDARRIVRA